MALKRAKGKVSTPAAKETPDFSAYTMRGIDRDTWAAFIARAKRDGRTARWVLDQFIGSYARQEQIPSNLQP